MILAFLRDSILRLNHAVVVRVQVECVPDPYDCDAKLFIVLSICFESVGDLLQFVKLFDYHSLRQVGEHVDALKLEDIFEKFLDYFSFPLRFVPCEASCMGIYEDCAFTVGDDVMTVEKFHRTDRVAGDHF